MPITNLRMTLKNKEFGLSFTLDNQQSQPEQFQAPDPMFTTTIMALAQGFPWDRFERFFESRPVINASAIDQVFLIRVLALQEMLYLNDAEVLKWVKNQLYLFAFISPDYKPKMPNEAVLEKFRQKLDELNILQPFRKRCQQIILNHSKFAQSPDCAVTLSGELMKLASIQPLSSTGDDSVKLSTDYFELPEIEECWVACPSCNSAQLNEYLPSHARGTECVPWANCQQCGHKFKIG